jgi:diguanylate cyclase (GGDEF)-like protein
LQDVPIIMLTGVRKTVALKQAFEAGAIDYIVKPIQTVVLLARVRSALRFKHQMDELKARESELLAVTSRLELANRELQAITNIDGLTGVGNRRYFDSLIHEEWRRARRERNCLALIMIDIDGFKAFNDAFGHQKGDECLRQVAQALTSVVNRAGDFVVRYGGEEFAAVLSNTSLAGAVSVAEKLRLEVAGLNIRHDASPTGGLLTISMGVAVVIPRLDGHIYDLIAAADQALYKAKNSGRDRIVVAESPDDIIEVPTHPN